MRTCLSYNKVTATIDIIIEIKYCKIEENTDQIINQKLRENGTKKWAENPLPDSEFEVHNEHGEKFRSKISDLTDDCESVGYSNFTIPMLKVIAEWCGVKLKGKTSKNAICEILQDKGIILCDGLHEERFGTDIRSHFEYIDDEEQLPFLQVI